MLFNSKNKTCNKDEAEHFLRNIENKTSRELIIIDSMFNINPSLNKAIFEDLKGLDLDSVFKESKEEDLFTDLSSQMIESVNSKNINKYYDSEVFKNIEEVCLQSLFAILFKNYLTEDQYGLLTIFYRKAFPDEVII